MNIEWRGEGCFEIRNVGDKVSLITELPNRDSGLTAPRTKTDIYLSIWGGLEDTLFSVENENRFVISNPGEYEVKDVFIKGIKLSESEGVLKTAYLISWEDINIAYLGEVAKKEITPEVIGFFETADVLILPVGGEGLLSAEEASDVISQIEPKIVIPSYYAIPGLKRKAGDLAIFLKEMGASTVVAEKKILIKKKDLTDGVKVVPLLPA